MAETHFIRTWKELDVKEIEKYLIIVGELSAECYACHKIGIESKSAICPACNTGFKYMAFRRKLEPHFIRQMHNLYPHILCIDFEDFKRATGKSDARRLLDF